tara:strand:+ start:35910 stop:36842 length:933 start_codon:yes stop_codon:yes gene_type:complete
MPRQNRIHCPNAFYHVILQGNSHQTLFNDKQDGEYCYDLLAQGVERYGHRIHAFSFLGSSIQLLIQVNDTPLSDIMHNLSFRYTRWVNKRHQRNGHVFAGRYRAILVEPGEHLLSVLRYIHLQPVREDLASKPKDYFWSGHRCYLGEMTLPWLTTDDLLQRIDSDIEQARTFYQGYVVAGMRKANTDDFMNLVTQDNILGSEEFIAKVHGNEQPQSTQVDLQQLLQCVCKSFTIDEQALASLGKQRSSSDARGVLAMLVKQQPHINFVELSHVVNRDATTLSAHAARIEKRCKQDETLKDKVNSILKNLE